MKRLTLLPAALAVLMLCSACSKNIQTTEDVHAGIMEYLTANVAKTGVDVNSMQIDVVAVNFQKDHAKATVGFRKKGLEMPPIEMVYNLDRKGDKWVVAGPPDVAEGHGAAAMPGGGAPDGQLPAGHPAVPDGPPGGHADPSGQLPAGHPPIGKQQ